LQCLDFLDFFLCLLELELESEELVLADGLIVFERECKSG
jgi:hypothetical protein